MKKIVGVLLVMAMCITMSINAFAEESVTSEKNVAQYTQEEFEKLVNFVITFKESNPDISKEDVITAVDRHILNTRGIDDISGIWSALTNEEKKLVIRYPFDALKVNSAKDVAFNATNIQFGYNGLGDRSDAFRHIMWNAVMTMSIGEYKAELFATAHEIPNQEGVESDGFSKVEHTNMDLNNNAIGRVIGSANLTADNEMLAEIISEEINKEDARIIWLHE